MAFAAFSMIRTFFSYFSSVKLDHQTPALNTDAHTYNIPPALANLTRQRQLQPSTVTEVLNGMNQSKFAYSESGLHSGHLDFPDRGDKNFVFVPVVLEGRFANHIIVLTYDYQNKRIEVYDSKGLTSADHSEKIICKDGLTLAEVVNKMAAHYGAASIYENKELHQKDSHNCGIYVLNYIERRLADDTPEAISQDGLSFTDANQTERNRYHQLLCNRLPQS